MDPNPESAQEAWEEEQGARKKFKGFAPRGADVTTDGASVASASASAAAPAAAAPAPAAATAAPAPAAASSKPAVRQSTIKPSFVPTSLLVRHRPAAAPAPVARPRAYEHKSMRARGGLFCRGRCHGLFLTDRCATLLLLFLSMCAVYSTRHRTSTWALRPPPLALGRLLPRPPLPLAQSSRSPRRRRRPAPKRPTRQRHTTSSWRDWTRCKCEARSLFLQFVHVARSNSYICQPTFTHISSHMCMVNADAAASIF